MPHAQIPVEAEARSTQGAAARSSDVSTYRSDAHPFCLPSIVSRRRPLKPGRMARTGRNSARAAESIECPLGRFGLFARRSGAILSLAEYRCPSVGLGLCLAPVSPRALRSLPGTIGVAASALRAPCGCRDLHL